MRIAWFTPWNRRSAIARYSRLVVEAVARRADIALLLPAGTAGSELSTSVPIVRYEPDTLPRLLEDFGVSVFNMGDSPFHFGVWDALRTAHEHLHPVVALLHDGFYLNLFHGHAHANGTPEAFREMLVTYYDSPTAARIVELVNRASTLEDLAPYALCGPIVAHADDFIVHSRFCRERAGLTGVPNVLELFIPAEYAALPEAFSDARQPGENDRLTLLTVGVGNRNKCLHLILEALAHDPQLARRLRYVAAGAVEASYLAEMQEFARIRRLRDVQFLGYVDDADLASLIARADLCVNLRKPCLEGGSASLLEALAAAKPVVVFDDGVYAELPDDCAVKLSKHAGGPQLAATLRLLVDDAPRRKAIGEAAQRFVREHWPIERYVDGLLEYLHARAPALSVRPGLRAAARRVGSELNDIALPPQGRTAHVVAEALGRWPS